ncbi:MAG: heavy-metal-associated domain-containing protein [Bacteroidota bacterium]
MKYLAYIFFFLFLVYLQPKAQIIRGELQAAGLTCAMCSNAIYKSLKTLKFIREIEVDLNRSSFNFNFKQGEEIDFDAIRKKVEDAGFSVSLFKFNADFSGYDLKDQQEIIFNHSRYCLLNAANLSSPIKGTFNVINRGFLSDKDYRKYAALIKEKGCSSQSAEMIYYIMISDKIND